MSALDSTPRTIAASQLLIEDAHQGVTSAAAQRTIERYQRFVQERRAPVASMNYSPFTRAAIHTSTVSMHNMPYHKPSELLEELVPASSSSSSSRAHSPSRDSLVHPGVPHMSTGGASWTLDFGHKSGANSKAASRRGSALSSRKTSLTEYNGKLFSGESRGSRNHISFENVQQIRHAQLSGSSARGSLSHVNAKELGFSLQDNGVTKDKDAKRHSLKQPYLRAHSGEQKYGGLTQHYTAPSMSQIVMGNKGKRASMPPLQNRNGLLGARRGSVTYSRQPTAAQLGASRARSQSLPTDSLFLAYSQCSLPAVMTSSLAAMPIPTQPGIPVSVARRYSVLSATPLVSGAEAAEQSAAVASEEVVHINPENVDGIDTSSVLDTTQLEDMAPEEDEEEEPACVPQPARRASVHQALRSALMQESASRQCSPASSPVEPADGPASIPAFPLSAAATPLDAAVGRTRSMIQTTQRNGLSIAAPTRDQLASTPDYTPMTSPTNLSNAMFKQTLMTRRMSEVVARDVSKKLKILKKHYEEAEAADNDSNGSVQAHRVQ